MFTVSRRKLLGTTMLGAGALLGGLGAKTQAAAVTEKATILLNSSEKIPQGLVEAINFPLLDAIQGRRSRRFAKGACIPEGPLAYSSKHKPSALSELQQMLLLTSVCGNTGWTNLIPHNPHYAPKVPNYAGAAGGRTFPSAAGFHTVDFFYTDDKGVYFLSTKDMKATTAKHTDGTLDLNAYLKEHQSKIVKISDGRLKLPRSPEHMEAHNNWCANVEGSTLIIPVADVAQHIILALCYLVQNGACLYDDINKQPIPGLSKFKDLINPENAYPISFFEQQCLTEATVELSTACYSGALTLQAMGLGGWMFDGINPFSIFGASGDKNVPGLGFSFDTLKDNPIPHVTGLKGILEGHCPPFFNNMKSAVVSVVNRKFGSGGPFNAKTDGPYKDNSKVRSSAATINEQFIDCVATMAQYIFNEFGRFPATVPAIFSLMYLQAHHIDTDFYDQHFNQNAYLKTHAEHDSNWS
jgi:hypothetical protein